MKAFILAAGKGTRLGYLTKDKPKGMLELNGDTILKHQINLFRSVGIDEIVVIRGYKKNKINYPNIRYIDNDKYDTTNMVESLMCAEKYLDGDCIVTYADLLFEKNVITNLLSIKESITVTVDSLWKEYWMKRYGSINIDNENLIVNDDKIIQIGQSADDITNIHYRYVGINKFDEKGINELLKIYNIKKKHKKDWSASGNDFYNGYLTDILQELIDCNIPLHCNIIKGGWLEIDTIKDYDLAIELIKTKHIILE